MQTDSAAMKGGANSQPASWEAVDEGAAAGLASDRLAQAKLPFQVPPSLIPQQGSGGAISGHKSTRDQVRNNLNKRLQAGILRDWTRGSSPQKFNKRWQPYASHGTEGPCFHKFPSVRDGTIT